MVAKKVATTPREPREPREPSRVVLTPKARLARQAPLIAKAPKLPNVSATARSARSGKPGKTEAQKAWDKAERKAQAERWEVQFAQQLLAYHLPPAERNALFLDGFMYRGDFIWRADRFCVEIDGGLGIHQMSKSAQRKWLQEAALLQMAGASVPPLPTQGGHHNSPEGYEHDRIRDIEAFLQGWVTIRLTPNMVEDGSGVRYVVRCYLAHCQRRAHQERSA